MRIVTRQSIIRTRAGEPGVGTDKRGPGEWCALEVEVREEPDGFLTLSICGSSGYILTPRQARAEALEYWESYFEDSVEALGEMNSRCGTAFRCPRRAAAHVLAVDGEYHGLDVYREEDSPGWGGKGAVYITTACGQIREELLDFFPEVKPYLRWHLNQMHAECIHQEERGETYSNHPGAVCGDCGYKLGSGWTRRELPAQVVAWAKGLPDTLKGKAA